MPDFSRIIDPRLSRNVAHTYKYCIYLSISNFIAVFLLGASFYLELNLLMNIALPAFATFTVMTLIKSLFISNIILSPVLSRPPVILSVFLIIVYAFGNFDTFYYWFGVNANYVYKLYVCPAFCGLQILTVCIMSFAGLRACLKYVETGGPLPSPTIQIDTSEPQAPLEPLPRYSSKFTLNSQTTSAVDHNVGQSTSAAVNNSNSTNLIVEECPPPYEP